jgi:hypothetical protein
MKNQNPGNQGEDIPQVDLRRLIHAILLLKALLKRESSAKSTPPEANMPGHQAKVTYLFSQVDLVQMN